LYATADRERRNPKGASGSSKRELIGIALGMCFAGRGVRLLAEEPWIHILAAG
jgi:hypothetical protein